MHSVQLVAWSIRQCRSAGCTAVNLHSDAANQLVLLLGSWTCVSCSAIGPVHRGLRVYMPWRPRPSWVRRTTAQEQPTGTCQNRDYSDAKTQAKTQVIYRNCLQISMRGLVKQRPCCLACQATPLNLRSACHACAYPSRFCMTWLCKFGCHDAKHLLQM